MSRANPKVLLAGLLVVLPLVGVLFANLGRDPHLIRSPLVGQPAPPFALRALGQDEPVRLESLRGRPVVLNFWATWCLPCLQEHPTLTAGARRYGDDAVFLGVVYQDEEANVGKFLARHGAGYATLMDPDSRTAVAYGVQGVPETYFINREGVVVAKYVAPLRPDTLAQLVSQAGAR